MLSRRWIEERLPRDQRCWTKLPYLKRGRMSYGEPSTDAEEVPGRVLPEGHGPEPIAVAISMAATVRVVATCVIRFADEADMSGTGNFLADAAKIGTQVGVGLDAESAVFEG